MTVYYCNTTKRKGLLVGTVFRDAIDQSKEPRSTHRRLHAVRRPIRAPLTLLLFVVFIVMFVMRIRRWLDVNDALNRSDHRLVAS